MNGLQRKPFAPLSNRLDRGRLVGERGDDEDQDLRLQRDQAARRTRCRPSPASSGPWSRRPGPCARTVASPPAVARRRRRPRSRSICCERSMRRRMMFESSTISSFSGRRVWPPSLGSALRRPRRLAAPAPASAGSDDREARVAPLAVADADPAAQLRTSSAIDVHADAAAGILVGDLRASRTRAGTAATSSCLESSGAASSPVRMPRLTAASRMRLGSTARRRRP